MPRNTDLQALSFPPSPFLLLNAVGDLGEGGFALSRFLLLGSLLFSRGGAVWTCPRPERRSFGSPRGKILIWMHYASHAFTGHSSPSATGKIPQHLPHHVMEHREEMVKGMNLARELEKDLKIPNIICMNGRSHLTSSRNEVCRDLNVTANSKKKQTLLATYRFFSCP